MIDRPVEIFHGRDLLRSRAFTEAHVRDTAALMTDSTRRDFMKKAAVAAIGVLAAHDDLCIRKHIPQNSLAEAHSASDFFPNFKRLSTVNLRCATINCVVGGSGPGLLLLHGYPQTHIMWRKMAPQLSEGYTVVVPDLRGYGDGSKPADGENHFGYSKRAMAQDMVELMGSLGFSDICRRAGTIEVEELPTRMALDHADAELRKLRFWTSSQLISFTMPSPKDVGTVYFHWFFLIQPAPFPETLIGGNAEFYF